MHCHELFVLAIALAACGESGTFSDAEIRAIREKLATMPAAPPANPSSAVADDPRAATLGQQLFFDARYSGNGLVSCATCHDPVTGFQDARANTSLGIAFTARHAPAVTYLALGQRTGPDALWEFWDGRADSQWGQALLPPENPLEMGGSRARVAYLIYDYYRADYEALFGAMPILRDVGGVALFPTDAKPGDAAWEALAVSDRDAITAVFVGYGKAIEAYERRLLPGPGRFDAFYADIAGGARDSEALTAIEKQGLRVFIGQGGCLECHQGASFTDFEFHNIGLAQTGPNIPADDPGREAGVPMARAAEFSCETRWSDHPDKAACAVSTLASMPGDRGAFKTPHLRDITTTAPYMHTGNLATIEDVIEHYDRGGDPSGFAGTVDDRIAPLSLTAADKRALAAFLSSLDSSGLPSALTTAPVLPGGS